MVTQLIYAVDATAFSLKTPSTSFALVAWLMVATAEGGDLTPFEVPFGD